MLLVGRRQPGRVKIELPARPTTGIEQQWLSPPTNHRLLDDKATERIAGHPPGTRQNDCPLQSHPPTIVKLDRPTVASLETPGQDLTVASPAPAD